MDQANASAVTAANEFASATRTGHNHAAKADAQDSFRTTMEQAIDRAMTKTGDPASEDVLPLEAYSLPQWYADLIPKQCVFTPGINTAYLEQVERYGADGTLTEQEKQTLRSMLENDPVRKERMENHAWRQEHGTELSEYMNLLHIAFQEALRENGVNTPEDYYQDVVLSPEGSEQVRRDTEALLAEQPRFAELMVELGVQA